MRIRWASAWFLWLAASTVVAQAAPTARIEAVRERLGASAFESAPGFELAGELETRGMVAPFTLWVGGRGRYELAIAGRLPSLEGFDGSRAYRHDLGTGERTLVLGDRDQQLAQTWFLEPSWTAADGRILLGAGDPLEWTFADSPLRGSIAFDAASVLPTRVEWAAGHGSGTLEIAEWKTSNGVRFPARWETRGSRGEVAAYSVERIEARSAPRRGAQLPAGLALDARVAGAGGAIEVEKAPTGHLLVHPTLGGREIGWFIFDTGAGANVLSTPVAEREGYTGFARQRVGGVGGVVDAQYMQPGELKLGPLHAPAPLFLTMDLAFLEPFLGREIAGVLGYPMLLAGVYELDTTTPRLALYPAGHEPMPGATPWEELVIYQAHSCVYADFEGDRRGLFTLDTGAGQGGVVFTSAATAKLDLLAGRKVGDAKLGGVGGFVAVKSGVIEWMRLGGRRFEAVSAMFPEATTGHVGDAYLTGTLSTKLLEPFTTVFDYRGGRIAFVAKAEEPPQRQSASKQR